VLSTDTDEGIGEEIDLHPERIITSSPINESDKARLHLCEIKVMLCAKAITYFTQEFDRKKEASRFFFSYDVEANHINLKFANFVSQVTLARSLDDIRKIWLYNAIILVQEATKPWRFSQENV
jgi:hypothetical protein